MDSYQIPESERENPVNEELFHTLLLLLSGHEKGKSGTSFLRGGCLSPEASGSFLPALGWPLKDIQKYHISKTRLK